MLAALPLLYLLAMKNLFRVFVIVLFFPFTYTAQVHCGLVELVPNTSINELLTFDEFSKYQGGMIINSVAKVRVRVEDKAIVDPLCSWSLTMQINNNPGAGTPITEWEELTQYGNGLNNNPSIDYLEVRVRNSCQTSPIDGTFQTFTNNGDLIDIIAAFIPVTPPDITPAGTCAVGVNGPGSYLANYNEFNFDIDVRVKPDFTLNPGIFQLNITFHLEENQ
jgi:hypothetical protein